jgi:hypothetical protein
MLNIERPQGQERLERPGTIIKALLQLPRAKTAKPETFIDNSLLAEIGKSGFVGRLYK